MHAWRWDTKRTFLRDSGMTLGDSPCTLLVSPWLGEVVGASLAMGQALVQPLLAPGAIVTVIRCSVGGPSECRVSSASLTCNPHILCLVCMNPNGMSIRGRTPEICGLQVVNTEKRYVRTDY